MEKLCAVCGDAFKEGDKLAAVMASTFKIIDSDVHFAITQPTQCLEIFHIECYDGSDPIEHDDIEVN